jgi:hypothetical protein
VNAGYGDSYGAGRIDVNLSFSPLQWILHLVTPVLAINGYPARSGWSRHLVDLPAGNHRIDTWFPYMFSDKCGMASAMVQVHPGHATRIHYEAPFLVFSNGVLRTIDHYPLAPQMPQAMPYGGQGGPPPGWGGHGQGGPPPAGGFGGPR